MTLVSLLAEKIHKDAEADAGRSRPRLAEELYASADALSKASKNIDEIYHSDR